MKKFTGKELMKEKRLFFGEMRKKLRNPFVFELNENYFLEKAVSLLLILSLVLLISCIKTENDGDSHQQLIAVPVVPEVEPEDINEVHNEGELVDDSPLNDNSSHSLFRNNIGTRIKLSSFKNDIDPIGTNISNDFDGDNFTNENEDSKNMWVADYPVIETNILPPVTMGINVELSEEGISNNISSTIGNEDTTNTIDNSFETVHNNEINLRTVQFQDSYNKSVSGSSLNEQSNSWNNSKSKSASASLTLGGFGGGKNRSSTVSQGEAHSSKISNSFSNSYGSTKTIFRDVPHKNIENRNGWALNRKIASQKARNKRQEIRSKKKIIKKITENAGYVNAKFEIKNLTVDMPVKLTEIRCSFLLETTEGDLLPVFEFELRKEDYSTLDIEIYGGNSSGPHIINLTGLSTSLILSAISNGYNPRLIITSYKMRHVEGYTSNYSFYGSFRGENLKIIEEITKGRTAGVKIVGPCIREFYRVVAFDTYDEDGNQIEIEDEVLASDKGIDSISPGVSLEKALKRISLSGTPIEFAYYIMDYSGMVPEMSIPKFIVRGIKSIGGFETIIPGPDPDGSPSTVEVKDSKGNFLFKAYTMKPASKWEDKDFQQFRLWSIFDDGKYYYHAGAIRDPDEEDGLKKYFYIDPTLPDNDPNREMEIPMVMGIKSTIWPGDHYDVAYIDLSEYLESMNDFGNNPLDTGRTVTFNTRWNLKSIKRNPFYPKNGIIYLGEVALGDTVEFTIKLLSTCYLNPDFGKPNHKIFSGIDLYTDFSYNWKQESFSFEMEEIIDFEISFGLGGEYSEWINLAYPKTRSPFSRYKNIFVKAERNNFVDQICNVELQIPSYIEGVSKDKALKIYMRPALNNAYRESIWPLPFNEVKKFRGKILENSEKGDRTIKVSKSAGVPDIGDYLVIESDINGYPLIESGEIESIDKDESCYKISLSSTLKNNHKNGACVYIDLSKEEELTESVVRISAKSTGSWNDSVGFKNNLPESSDIDIDIDIDSSNPFNNDFFKKEFSEIDKAPLVGVFFKIEWPLFCPGWDLLGIDNKFDSDEFDSDEFDSDENDSDENDSVVCDSVVCNWIGNNSYGNPYWNNWTDSSFFETFLNAKPFLIKDSDIFLFVGENRNFQISSSTIDNQCKPQLASSGDCCLVVWQSKAYGGKTSIQGRIVNMETGLPTMKSDFTISSDGEVDHTLPQLVSSGDCCLVVWQSKAYGSKTSIQGRIVNMETGLPTMESDFTISSNNGRHHLLPQIVSRGDRVLVVWEACDEIDGWDNTNQSLIMGRMIDLIDSTNLGTVFNISSSYRSNQRKARVTVSGDKAIVVWLYTDILFSFNYIYGRFIDFNSGEPVQQRDFQINNELVLDSFNNYNIDAFYNIFYPQVACSNEKALVLWGFYNDNKSGIRGHVLDFKTCSPVDGDNLLIYSSCDERQMIPQVLVYGDKAFVGCTSSDGLCRDMGDILARMINLTENKLIKNCGFYIDSNGRDTQMIISDKKILVAWSKYEKVEYALTSNDSNIQGLVFDIENYSQLNDNMQIHFFTSPLIERNYEVSAEVKDVDIFSTKNN